MRVLRHCLAVQKPLTVHMSQGREFDRCHLKGLPALSAAASFSAEFNRILDIRGEQTCLLESYTLLFHVGSSLRSTSGP